MRVLIKAKDKIIEHPFLSQLEGALVLSFIIAIVFAIGNLISSFIKFGKTFGVGILETLGSIIVGTIIIFFLVLPFVATVYEIIHLIVAVQKKNNGINRALSAIYDASITFVGSVLEILLLNLGHDVVFEAQWFKELRNQELHTPINHDYALTFIILIFIFVVGISVIAITDSKRPPLVTVICIAFMYIGVIVMILFTIQIMGMHMLSEDGTRHYKFEPDLLMMILMPFNMIVITLRVIFTEINNYEPDENRMSKIDGIPILGFLNKVLKNSKTWPAISVIMMIPVLGIIIGILVLFGQAPDAAIKAFTETANYTFSTKIPPQNVFYDEHYLCTVAAGGHRKIVKPLRMGKRHGHDVIVNRQLCVANAFEQILEEKTPSFHRIVRNFYDKYGFPVAKIIKSKYTADFVWFLMKPLEWLFIIVIYLVDVNPEDRIASQYLY